MKLGNLIREKIDLFKINNIENPIYEIRFIILEKLGFTLEDQVFNKNIFLNHKQITGLEQVFKERLNGKPLSRIFNKSYFREISLKINRHTFCPRIDSEILIDIIISKKIKIKNFLELGTGSGALSISLLKNFKSASCIVTDISKEAIYIAKKNAILNNTLNQMQFICCDWLNCFDNLDFDILISNPPYINKMDIENLDKEVKDYDPIRSLDGGNDGLTAYKRIINDIRNIGKKNLLVLFEIGFNQAHSITAIMEENNFKNIQVFKDYRNLPRCILGVT